jgi:hypothetical protein
MLDRHSYNVENPSDFVAECSVISVPAWENEKLSEVLKINGEDVRVSPLMIVTFKLIASIDKALAKKVIIRVKLIWEYMQLRKSCDKSNIKDYSIPTGSGEVTLWKLFEVDICRGIRGDGITASFDIYHQKDFAEFQSIRVSLSGQKTRLIRWA